LVLVEVSPEDEPAVITVPSASARSAANRAASVEGESDGVAAGAASVDAPVLASLALAGVPPALSCASTPAARTSIRASKSGAFDIVIDVCAEDGGACGATAFAVDWLSSPAVSVDGALCCASTADVARDCVLASCTGE
jgi:hypothetical protein